ncbi:MAG: hypothetical protein IIX41_00265 [Bacteroidales bacterium]|jgi:hypothetical protein|nr:hypothetical protein [Bacteroidales bacterium]
MAADPLPNQQQLILKGLQEKAYIKSCIYSQSLEVFNELKEVLSEISNDLTDILSESEKNKKIRLEYRDRGKYEAELKFADDVLVFSMHTDIFQFDRDHAIWKNSYSKESPYNTYCGVISVYNFLSDSLKFSRNEDLGYLVARMFVNKDKKFFVEGKRQSRQKISSFGKVDLTKEELVNFVESAMLYSLSFDLLVPPFDLVKVASVEQINAKIESAKMRTGKRMGYKYNSDDVLENE